MKKISAADLCYCLRPTPFGSVVVMWSRCQGRPGIRSVVLSKPGEAAAGRVDTGYPDAVSASCAEIDAMADQMVAFLSGADIRFSLDLARLDFCTGFQRRVLLAEYGIPRGKVSTYAEIARFLGNVKAARAVGAALAHNPFPLMIPCHRAIRADGTLGGFQGGVAMKRRLLEMEGVPFTPAGRVAAGEACHYWDAPKPDCAPPTQVLGEGRRRPGELGR
jgi:methylated-DNA-[protein]-cysteine S-methyltransferase